MGALFLMIFVFFGFGMMNRNLSDLNPINFGIRQYYQKHKNSSDTGTCFYMVFHKFERFDLY